MRSSYVLVIFELFLRFLLKQHHYFYVFGVEFARGGDCARLRGYHRVATVATREKAAMLLISALDPRGNAAYTYSGIAACAAALPHVMRMAALPRVA